MMPERKKKTCENCMFSHGPWEERLKSSSHDDFAGYTGKPTDRSPYRWRYSCRRNPPSDGWPTVAPYDWRPHWQDDDFAVEEWN